MAHSSIVFDTLKYANKLKAAGFTEKQAEVQAETLAEIIDERLATKQDLRDLELRLIDKLTMRFGYMLGIAVAFLSVLIAALEFMKK